MNESQKAVLLITFRVGISSVKRFISTCIHSPSDISIKGSEKALKDPKDSLKLYVLTHRHLLSEVSKTDQYILIKYTALISRKPCLKEIKG